MEARTVFQTLYCPAVIQGLRISAARVQLSSLEALATIVEEHMVSQFVHL